MQPLTVGSFIRAGWELFKQRPWFLVGASLLIGLGYGIAAMLMGFASSIVITALGESVQSQAIIIFVQYLLTSLIWLSAFVFFLKAHSNINDVRLPDLWQPRHFLQYVGTTILVTVVVFAGLILLVIPGLIASMAFMFAPYLAVDKGLDPISALKESARITKGNRWRLFALSTAIVLLVMLGYMALLVGAFVAMPIVVFAGIEAYRRLSAAADSGAARHPLTIGEKILAGLFLLLPILGIVSAIFLSSLNVAREQAITAREQAQLAALQYALELTYNAQGSYPQSLEGIAPLNDEDMATIVREISIEDFAYVAGADGATYGLCAPPLSDGTERCVNSLPPENTAIDESIDVIR